MWTETNMPQPLPVLQDVGDIRLERYERHRVAQNAANKRYKQRRRITVVAPRLGIDEPTVFSSITSFKRHALKIVKAWYPYDGIDTEELLEGIDRLYAEYKSHLMGERHIE